MTCLKPFKKQVCLISGTSEDANAILTELKRSKRILVGMGSEEGGMREKTLEKCSKVCTVSKNKIINSLNVSVATGVILFEVARQKLI